MRDEPKKSPWKRRLLIAAAVLLLIIMVLPTLLVSRTVLVPLVNRYAGIAPLTVDFDSVSGGWISTFGAKGIRLADVDGKVLISVKEVTTEKSIFGFATNRSNLGTVNVVGVESIVECENGTTNLEKALQPILDAATDADPVEDQISVSEETTGKIVLSDSKLMITQAGRPEQWVIELPSAMMELPAAGQMLGPTQLSALIADASGTVKGSPAAIDLQLAATDAGRLNLTGEIVGLPLEFWHIVHDRLPGIPIDTLAGRVSTKLSGHYATLDDWEVNADGIEGKKLRVDAPSLVGEKPVEIQLLTLAGGASAANGRLAVRDVRLQCDFANAAASGDVAWPLQIPTLAAPVMASSKFDVRGTVDLPKLVVAAESLIPVRDDLQLNAGTAQFILKQDRHASGNPGVNASVRLQGFDAVAAGQTLTWTKPLTLDLGIEDAAGVPSLTAGAQTDFGNLKLVGDLLNGSLEANLNLDDLHRELGKWVELPVNQMEGSVVVGGQWKTDPAGVLNANLQLQTTPLVIASESGQTNEPAWRSTVIAAVVMKDSMPQTINRASVALESDQEKLLIDLLEPMSVVAASESASKLPPASFSVTLNGELSNWQRRAGLLLTEPLPVSVGGNIALGVQGKLDLSHAEVTSANWNAEPLRVATESMVFSESRMIGNFKGVVNTENLLQLAIDELTVQSTAISLLASDSAVGSGDSASRKGKATFRMDLNRLLSNLGDAAKAPEDQIVASGMVDGQLSWTVDSANAALVLNANGQQIIVSSRTAENPAGSQLWAEPTVVLGMQANWQSATGAAKVDGMSLRTEWLNYDGSLVYEPAITAEDVAVSGLTPPSLAIGSANAVVPASATVRIDGSQAGQDIAPGGAVSGATANRLAAVSLDGNLVYDCNRLSGKLEPFTGGQVQLMGQHTTPVRVRIELADDPQASMLRGLDASANIGWQRALVAGIEIGQSAVPITVLGGILKTKTEVPVSKGTVRWDATSDLAADVTVIELAPANVLENVAITEEMCKGWLKFVAPLLAEATSIDGRLTLRLDEAKLTPAEPARQTVRGTLLIHDAQVGPGPLSTQILAIVSQIEALRQGSQSLSSQQTWLLLPEQRIAFQMADGRVQHQNLNVKIGDASISTSGSVSVDGQMDLVASMPIPDNWVASSPLLEGIRGQAVQFPIAGSITQPQINTDFLRQFGRQAVRGAAEGLLKKGLSRGLESLFGPPGGGNQ